MHVPAVARIVLHAQMQGRLAAGVLGGNLENAFLEEGGAAALLGVVAAVIPGSDLGHTQRVDDENLGALVVARAAVVEEAREAQTLVFCGHVDHVEFEVGFGVELVGQKAAVEGRRLGAGVFLEGQAFAAVFQGIAGEVQDVAVLVVGVGQVEGVDQLDGV